MRGRTAATRAGRLVDPSGGAVDGRRGRVRRLAWGATTGVAAAGMWGGVLADRANSPSALASPARQLSLHDELTWALAQRAQLSVAASRSAAPPPAPPPDKVWPAAGALTGWFGERRGGHRHPGIDVDGDTGDPVVAAAAGTVLTAGPSPAGYAGYGTVVIIDHDGGVVSVSAHLSRVAVRAGQAVSAGQVVGAVGTSGNVTGSHLHFEVRRGGVKVDPKSWLPKR